MASLNDIETRILNIVDILDYRAVTTITGVLPLTFRSNGTALIDYRIFGTAEGVGVQTKNLINIADITIPANVADDRGNRNIFSNLYLDVGTYTVCCYQENTLTSNTRNTLSVILPDKTRYYESISTNFHLDNGWHTLTFTLAQAGAVSAYMWGHTLSNDCVYTFFMLVPGFTAPSSYIPYGYELPLTITNGTENKTSDIYIGDSKLLSGDYVDYESGKIVRNGTPQDPPKPFSEIDTYIGINTLDSAETLGEVTIKGKIKEVI